MSFNIVCDWGYYCSLLNKLGVKDREVSVGFITNDESKRSSAEFIISNERLVTIGYPSNIKLYFYYVEANNRRCNSDKNKNYKKMFNPDVLISSLYNTVELPDSVYTIEYTSHPYNKYEVLAGDDHFIINNESSFNNLDKLYGIITDYVVKHINAISAISTTNSTTNSNMDCIISYATTYGDTTISSISNASNSTSNVTVVTDNISDGISDNSDNSDNSDKDKKINELLDLIYKKDMKIENLHKYEKELLKVIEKKNNTISSILLRQDELVKCLAARDSEYELLEAKLAESEEFIKKLKHYMSQ